MIFRSELEFEEALINRLFHKGWSNNVLKYKTEEDLIRNWANILFNNNRGIDQLNDVPLTESEMEQILDIIKIQATPYNLHSFINGKSVTIKRDNPLDRAHLGKEVTLSIYNRDEIAGGKSIYQIAEQPIFKKHDEIGINRRGDFMLLINGMPVIHVELKKDGIPVSQAVNQIQKYMHEGVFRGLFSLVQIFVAMTPSETLYFANPGNEYSFLKEYQFHWADFNNERIDDWEGIAEHLLSIPMAHMMIGYYTVADSSDKTLKVLRSYQYNACAAISSRVHNVFKDFGYNHETKGGYIWHTTGSGKTLTSFKAAQLIANSNDANKVVFLLDRIELGIQSLDDYKNFSDDDESVQGTEHTSDLYGKLKSDNINDTLIVSSIQKMDILARLSKVNQIDLSKINNKKIVIVIDECHRDTFGEMMINIKSEFNTALYFGFTGTPIHEENAKKGCTTPDIFGNELHRYTIADGIRDGNVLGFDPQCISTFDSHDLKKEIALSQAKAKTEEEALDNPEKNTIYLDFMNNRKMEDTIENGVVKYGIEHYIPKSQYNESLQKHKKVVVEEILRSFLSTSSNRKFHGILATSSINEAIEYYRLFKIFLKDEKYPRINITAIFDPSIDNNDNCIYKEDGLIEILKDYNEKFNQIYNLSTAAGFKKDVCNRLAHKDQYIAIDNDNDQKVDLVIVVDQLLTGFDSKWVNVLYLDKILRNEQIIQAFSRTNRLFNKVEKPHGIIKIYRKPYTMKKLMNEALKLYSGDKPFGVFVDKLDLNLQKANLIFKEIKQLFDSYDCNDFFSLDNFDMIGKAKFAKLFIKFNQVIIVCRIQGMSWDDEKDFTEADYLSLLQRYKELASKIGKINDSLPFDIDPAIIAIPTDLIDSEFMQSKFKKWLTQLDSNDDKELKEKALNDLHNSFSTLSKEDQKVADMIIYDIHSGKLKVDSDKTFKDYIEIYKYNIRQTQIFKFSSFIGVDNEEFNDFLNTVNRDNINEYGKLDSIKRKCNVKELMQNLQIKYNERYNPGKAVMKLDFLIRKFVEDDGFDIDNID